MQQLWINFILILVNWSFFIHAKAIIQGSSNETLLIGQINGPSGGAARNLLGMMLSMNVFFNNTRLHYSLVSITNSTFPLNYSIVLTDHDFQLENATNFDIVCMIWQPAYIYEENVILPENEIDKLNFVLRTIKFVFIRGEIVHEKHGKDHDLPARHVKLEVIEDRENGSVIDQVDFICRSTKYPCPFEYWLDTSRIKANVEYTLEAILTDRVLPARKSAYHKHHTKFVRAKSTHPKTFKINPHVDTELNDYKIVVNDIQ